ncbi:MAG: L-seryl-tRNA(Sec) selenium transferase [Candidatus Cloacimonadota bacterium]|nr:L-seryl-tRNA(Sec) selenium transferase [Candidatus Cloacimonadota bacterium]
MNRDELRKIPKVEKLQINPRIVKLAAQRGRALVTYSIKSELENLRAVVLKGSTVPNEEKIVTDIIKRVEYLSKPSLKKVINATGIVLHTNLARAPLGSIVLEDIWPILVGYSNLEYDLEAGKRGERNSHIREIIKFITNAEEAVVVNNNAAALMFCLNYFAKDQEVIISRGELIEIGGSFRIPDIMRASGAKMVEVGTTNRTRLEDYENAITSDTRIILKAHKSNYYIKGFTEEPSVKELADLARKNDLIFLYDIGSGLLRKPENMPLENEPDVKTAIEAGADIVTFSGDKLLGGPQAGIIVGKQNLVSMLAKAPMMRVLRVGKITLAALSVVTRAYLQDEKLKEKIPLFKMLNYTENELKNMAKVFSQVLGNYNIEHKIVDSISQVGGGTLPYLELPSWAIQILPENKDRKFAKKIFSELLQKEPPILGIMREGKFLLDVRTIFKEDFDTIAKNIKEVLDNYETR